MQKKHGSETSRLYWTVNVFWRLSIRKSAEFERSDSPQSSNYGHFTVACHMKKKTNDEN